MKLYELLKVTDMSTKCRIYQEGKKDIVDVANGYAEQLMNRVLPICVLEKEVAYVNIMMTMEGIALNILLVK